MKLISGCALAMLLTGAALAAAPQPPAPPSGPATPATPDPAALSEPAGMIRDLYTRYFKEAMAQRANPDAPQDAALDWNAIADKYFTPELAARFKKANADKEQAVFDWDFFIAGQDFDSLAVVSVDATTIDSAKATVRVVTSNSGHNATTDIFFEKRPEGWRIAEFVWNPDEGKDRLTMTGVLKESGY